MPLSVLIIEDSELDAELVLSELRRGGYDPKYERVDTLDALQAALDKGRWDVILCDYVMPRFSGLAALKAVQERGLDLPFILVTGQIGEETAVDAMKTGAHDYVMKDKLSRLVPAVQRELRDVEVRQRRKQAEEALRKAHEELRRANTELESRVAERTAALVKANQELAAEITERKHAEEEQERLAEQLREANSMLLVANLQAQDRARDAERRAAELDAAIAAIADGIAITDPESRIIRMNAAAERVLGLTGEEARRPLAERLRLERVETVDGRPFPLEEMPIWRALRYGETNSGVIMIIHNARTGEGTWVSNSSAPIRAADGSILGAITVYADITAVQNLQEQREDLLRAVSHDLRSPLQVIQGQAQYLLRILERSGHDGVEQNSARSIIAGAKRMNAMIQDLVDSAQMEAGQLPLEDQPLDLRAFLIDLLRRNSGVLAVQRVKVEIPENLPHVDADPNRLGRIFVNLLSNALKYSAPGTSVLVGATPTDREVTVSVADRGIGINSEDIPRLFQRYARTKRAGRIEGIGLGLYITRLLVEAHGGRIWVDSTPDEGSTFYFSLPLKEGRTAVPE